MLSWVYLQQLLGYGSSNTKKVLENLKNPKGIEKVSSQKLAEFGFTQKQISKHGQKLLSYCEDIIDRCNKNGITIIPYGTEKYPKKLTYIYSPAVVLYSIGAIPDFDNKLFVAVVGPRKISEYGSKTAFSLSARLSLCGANIVSGGAVGGDSYAHQGALAVEGATVVVTGGGFTGGYLLKNQPLRQKILNRGNLLITEFSPDYIPKDKNSFHLRNRILAGISDVVAIVEAGEKSGTLITAQEALEQGKDIFAFCGDVDMPQYKGTARLIEEGAKPLKSPLDILNTFSSLVNTSNLNDITAKRLKELYVSAYNELNGEIPKKAVNKKHTLKVKKAPPQKADKNEVLNKLNGDMKQVYSVLDEGGKISDDVVNETGLSTSTVLCALTKLEIMGYVKSLPGSRYCIK